MNDTEMTAQTCPPATSLDTPETKAHSPEDDSSDWVSKRLTASQQWRHGGWEPVRNRVIDALVRADSPKTRREAFCNCGRTAWVLRTATAPYRVRIAWDRCHDRFCTPCARERSAIVRAAIRERMGSDRYRFVTLTLRQTADGLAGKLTELTDCFGRLRRTRFWTKAIKGGLAVYEIKRNTDTGLWNVHVHALTHGRYLDQPTLKREWHRITGDSFIVDVREVKDANKGADYVAKYATKAFDNSVTLDPDALVEAIRALAGKRLVVTFGTWRGFALTATEPSDEGWELVGPLERLIAMRREGNAAALWLLHALETGDPTENHPMGEYPGDPRLGPDDHRRYAVHVNTTQTRFDFDGNTTRDWAAVDCMK